MSDKFSYLEALIAELSENDKFKLPVFLLKCQLAEYGLKYLLGGYPYKPDSFLSDDFLDKATMGQVIGKLEELNDGHLSDIIKNAKSLLVLRNEMTHNFLTASRDVDSIERDLEQKAELVGEIEAGVHYLFDFISEVNR